MADQDSITVTTLAGLIRSFICEGIFRFCARNIIREINNKNKDLISRRDYFLGKVEEIGETTNAVLKWLNDVEKALDEVEMLEKKMETESRLLGIYGVDHETYWRYNEMVDIIGGLNYNFPMVGPIPHLQECASEYFVTFKSTEEASEQLWKALHDDSSYVIGLYGRRNSGKTTLAKAVGERSKYVKTFSKVAFATVSKNVNVSRIQDDIAASLGLTFSDITKEGRAGTISSELTKESGSALVILDDVRAKVELEDIGIPLDHGNCKVLLTTHSQLECALMDCQLEIPLHPLSKEEAWMLLKYHSGINEDSSYDLLNLAQEVAFECEGLPGIIKKVGSSLKNDPIEVWKASLEKLKHSKAYNQIFLSFKGGDTCFSFTGFLYHDLCEKGLKTFMDDGELYGEEQISPSIIKAIEASWLSIIVLSENYANSARCLDELVKILECKKMKNQLVWPIFYKVEPSDIRYQQSSYGTAMAEHAKSFGNDSEKIQKWKSALFEVSNLSGKAYKTGYEYEFIQRIMEEANNIKNYLDVE
ncbi:disease resistance protein UNI-like [Lotus japonicus]|uniref:disease resistance protein UNI-like n=1 Tax=Lotus japonicus TaxID=34305 RepID=UPI0025854830|nr:disease resistance protein UNI-like [Lotus japonicus]